MAYVSKTWQDRITEHPSRRKLTATGETDTYDIARAEGTVITDGDAFDAATMNDLENRIVAGFDSLDYLPIEGGTATGNLAIEMGGYPQFKLANTANNTKAIVVLGTHNIQLCQYNASDGTTYRRLTLFDSAGTSNIANALTLNDYISGTGTTYMVYGSHNVTVSTAAPTAALAANAMHMVY